MLFVTLGLISCSKKEHYYKIHPNELQQALNACPEKQPQDITCHELEVLAKRMSMLVYELQISPQDFGKKIMALQEIIAKEQEQLKLKGVNTNLHASLSQNKHDLVDRLAIVKWFESPSR